MKEDPALIKEGPFLIVLTCSCALSCVHTITCCPSRGKKLSTDLAGVRRSLGVCFQQNTLFDQLTVLQVNTHVHTTVRTHVHVKTYTQTHVKIENTKTHTTHQTLYTYLVHIHLLVHILFFVPLFTTTVLCFS